MGVNTFCWIDANVGASGSGPESIGRPFSSSPSPLPAQPLNAPPTTMDAAIIKAECRIGRPS
jgi:hypothetical protein